MSPPTDAPERAIRASRSLPRLWRDVHRLAPAVLALALASGSLSAAAALEGAASERTRVIVTTDAEIDDQCSLVRFLLYANEWDIEGIITTSSQYRWQGYKWPGDEWAEPYLDAYEQVYPYLVRHDPAYPAPALLRARTVMGNARAEGDMAKPTPGSELIVSALLDRSDPRPVWLQAWGGVNTIARALKSIEELHPDRMAEVAAKCRLFLIWEQDATYQDYIRPVWGKYGILTIISDQFEAIAYRWKQAQPASLHRYFEGAWMRTHLLKGRGPLTALYHSHENGDFRSEGDSPAFLHTIPTGLRSLESPDWGGWGGRYVRVRENTWLDPVPVPGYAYPEGRWYGNNGWGRDSLRPGATSTAEQRQRYFEPMWRWTPALQNDFAARAAWCVLSYEEANHPPVVVLAHPGDLLAAPGDVVPLSAHGTTDPDGDVLMYRWWHYEEAGTHEGPVVLSGADRSEASFTVPVEAVHGTTLHVICEVTDNGTPSLTRYGRVVVRVHAPPSRAPVVRDAGDAVAIPRMTARLPLDGSTEVVGSGIGGAGSLLKTDPALAWGPGILAGALQLDGRGAYVVVPHHEAFDFGEESFSVSFWLRWPAGLLPGRRVILAKGGRGSDGEDRESPHYTIAVDRGGLQFTLGDAVAESRLRVPLAPFVTGEWVHVAAIRDRENGRLRLYAQGERLPTSSPGNPADDGTDRSGSVANPHHLHLGGAGGKEAPFHGGIDDLRFFRAALTDTQVAALASGQPLREVDERGRQERRLSPAPPSALPPMAAHLPLTEGQGATFMDAVKGVKGRLEEVDLESTWTSSDRGLALRLDGVDDRGVIPHLQGLSFTETSFAVALHLRWIGGGAREPATIIAVNDPAVSPASVRGWELGLTQTGLVFRVHDGSGQAMLEKVHPNIFSGQWLHVVAVRNADLGRLEIYLDGEQHSGGTVERAGRETIQGGGGADLAGSLVIGASPAGGGYLPAELADIRIYRSALDAAQALGVARLRRNAAANSAETTQPGVVVPE